ncbi:MAG: hypothetical protein HYY35_04365 [Deltaproteobacteria bacterium]|nr:hypothetical protein [Deltaproteobacteria bacterium]
MSDGGAETARELDMGFTVEEVAQGVERLLAELALGARKLPVGGGWRFDAAPRVTIEIDRMPESRIRHPTLFPRTLLTLRGETPVVEALYRKILLAFLRVGG